MHVSLLHSHARMLDQNISVPVVRNVPVQALQAQLHRLAAAFS